MGSTAGARARGVRPANRRVMVHVQQALALALLALLIFVAIVFAARRLAGGFAEPPGGLSLVIVAVVVGAAVIGIQRGLSSRIYTSTEYSVRSTQYLALVLASAAAAVLLAALTMRGTPAWGIAGAWFLLVSLVLLLPLGTGRRWQSTMPEIEDTPVDAPPANLVQQLTRQRDESGGESLHALAAAEIPAGDQLGVLHLALCPPLEAAPQLMAHALDADDAEVKITTAETYGARLEVRLARSADQPRRILVEVLGSAPAAKSL